MKKVFKTIFLSFICVVAALGLLVGGMYLFGGFEEKEVYAENLSFSVSEIISNEPFALKITTTTPDVNRKNLRLSVLAGDESVIDFPSQVEIDEIFTVIPKQTNGTNFGGNVTLVATYDYDNSNQSVKAYCEIMIDVPVNELQIKKEPITTTLKQNILLASKDAKVSDLFGINPTNALMPYVEYGTQKITNITDKKLYLQLVYKNQENIVLEKNVAKFVIDGVPQDKEFIEVSYSYKDVLGNGDREIVFNNDISVETYEKQEEVYIVAYLYSTYKDQNLNTIGEVVSLNKNTMVIAKLAMAIGDYEIVNMTIDEDDREVYLNEDTYIYLNNPNVTGNNINLAMELETGSPGIPANDFYLLNTYIKIDNEPYRLLSNNLGSSDTVDGWLSINHDDISRLEKNEWRWKLNVNNFLAYKNNTPLKATVKFEYYDADKDKTTIFEKEFNIVVKINQVENVEVTYPENKQAFDIASGDTLNLVGKFDSTPSIAQNSKYAFDLYLSYSENYENGKTTISTVPTSKTTYKVKFDFVIDDSTQDYYVLNVDRAASNKWCEINEVKYTQISTTERSYFIDYKSGSSNGENRFEPNKTISVEAVIVLKAQPTEEELFYINYDFAGETVDTCMITDFMAKFYELVDTANNTYSQIPYLNVDGVRYHVDFDYYLDETTLTKYLKINNDLTTTNSFKVQGIGTIYITAQLVYKEDNVSYWLDKSVTAKAEIFEEIKGINAFEYIDNGNGATFDNAFNTTEIVENEKDADENAIYRYIFITSNEIDALKNYISPKQQVEIYARQIFSLDKTENDRIINAYTGIQNINKNAISFEENWQPVIVNDVIVGFRIGYSIGEVFDIEVDEEILQNKFLIEVRVKVNGEYVYAKFLVKQEGSDVEQDCLNVNVKNIVLSSAEINYNGSKYGYSEDGTEFNPFEIYANIKNGNEVYYRTVSGSSDVDFNNLKYFFKYNDTTKTNTTQTLTATFDAVDVDGTGKTINMTNGGAYYSFEKSEDGVGGLIFKNFPRFENGVVVKMTITSSTMLNFNSKYVFNQGKNSFEQIKYDLTSDFYFRVYGLVVDIKAKDSTIYGAKDSEFVMLGTAAENSAFDISIKSQNPNVSEPTTCQVSNYLDLVNVSVVNTELFKQEENGNLIYNEKGSTLTFAKDILEDQNVVISFYIGDASNSSLVYINVVDEMLPSYSQKVISPFEVELVSSFEAPSKDKQFVTVLYKTQSFDNLDEETLAIRRTEAIQKALERLDINVEFISSTLNSSYNITTPISISNNLLSFKAIPTTDESQAAYTADMRVVLSLKSDGTPRRIDKNISIFSSILASDIQLGNFVDAGEDSYYSINAGVEYIFDKNAEDAINEGIVISGKLNDNFSDVRNIVFDFEDVSYEVDADINVDANDHMKVTPFDENTKNFGIMSLDLNYSKVINVKFTIFFNNGGLVIINKEVVVNPNLSMKLSVNTYKENEVINMTQVLLISRDNGSTYESLDILVDFEYNDPASKYNKDSFKFNSLAFRDSSGSKFEYFILGVQPGASELSEEQRVITFNYVAEDGYILVFDFVVNITAY